MRFPLKRGSPSLLLLGLLTVAALVFVVVALVQSFGEEGASNENPPPVPAPPGAPNILVFVTDDQRTESMEVMPRTSEYFVDEGAWFPNGFSTTPVCCPARASIFSGRFVHNHGVKRFTPYKLDQDTTLQATLQANGYRTAFYGKYLNEWVLQESPPFFDDWAAFPQSNATTYSGGQYNLMGGVVDRDKYSTRLLRDRAFRFLERGESENDTRPWLMYISTPSAHIPYVAEPRFAAAPVGRWKGNAAVFEDDLSEKPRHVRRPYKGKCDLKCGRRIRRQQHRTLMSVDVMVDDVMKRLEELGQANNTLALFVSDNGRMWGEHGLGNKRYPYKQSVNVPFGMRWPDHITPGADKRLVSLVDIAPTVLDASGVDSEAATEMDGRSLLDGWRREEMLLEHWDSKAVPAYGSLWSKEYQYTEYYSKERSRVFFREYFDLRKDPWQLENLLEPGSKNRPGRRELKKLSKRLDRFSSCDGSDCP
ncbi:MAG: sulfatase family protein [Actinomycetota bacterium]